jgi:protein-disulfide isomerase
MRQQTPLRHDDLPAGRDVGLDDRPVTLSRPVDQEDHRIGSIDAAVQLVEYGDYECPFCSQALPCVQQLIGEHGDRVLFVFRHFPLVSQHPHAWHAAQAAEAAGTQNRFWQMHDHLLSHQHSLTDDELEIHAGALGLDVAAFERDRKDPDLSEHIRRDALSGLHSGVAGTPTFFLNGRRLEGGARPGELEAATEAALAARPN